MGRNNKLISSHQFQNPLHGHSNQSMLPHQPCVPNQPVLQYPQQPIYPQPMWDEKKQ